MACEPAARRDDTRPIIILRRTGTEAHHPFGITDAKLGRPSRARLETRDFQTKNVRWRHTMRNMLLGVVLAVFSVSAAMAAGPQMNIGETVVKKAIADNISMDDAVESMKLRANTLNLKVVGHQPMYKELEALGIKSRRVEIFQFCDAGIGWELHEYQRHCAA